MPIFETVTFAPGDTTAQLEVPTVEDTTNELDEVFFAALQNPTGGAVLGASSNATIPVMDDDRMSACLSVCYTSCLFACHVEPNVPYNWKQQFCPL